MIRLVPVLSLATLLFVSCSDQSSSPSSSSQAKGIFVSNYPLAYFAERLAGNAAPVIFPEIDGDPAFWKPTAADIKTLQNARVLLFNGAGYEKWAATVTLPASRVTDTSKSFADDYLAVKSTVTHSHGPAGDHSHDGTAFTTWIDPVLATRQAEAVRDALVNATIVDPAQADAALTKLEIDLAALDDTLETLTAQNNKIFLIASHPVYDYFARRYKLDIQPVLWEPDVAPSEDEWTKLEKLLKSHPAKWMIWEGDPLPESVKRLESLGLRSAVFNPCGNHPPQGDFLSVMRKNAENLKPVFASE
jgi:zinc transport system substrate-binding protein